MFKLPKLFTTKWKNIHSDFTRELKEEWKSRGFSYEETKEWIDIGLTPEDFVYAHWLRDIKEKDPDWVLNYGDEVELRREYNNYLPFSQGSFLLKSLEVPIQDSQSAEFEIEAQIYLEQNYPTPEDKSKCEFLNLGVKDENNPDGLKVKTTGSLDLTGFTSLKTLWCGGQKITNLNLRDCSQLEHLQCWGNELTELDLSNCPQLKILGCSENKLTNLDCSNCKQLEDLNCSGNQLTQLDLRKNKNLTELWCSQNQLTQLIFPPQPTNLEKLVCDDNFINDLDWEALNGEKLTMLSLQNNNFHRQTLSCLSKFTNLKKIYLGNTEPLKISQGIYNRWTGSLQPLQNMKQLYTLHIDNTDLTRGSERLPASVMEISCSHSLKPDSKVKLIVKELEQNSNFTMDSFSAKSFLKKKLPWEILNQIKDFNHRKLTPEQEKLLTELIPPSAEWRKHYKRNGLCFKCWQLNGDGAWCQPCNLPHLQANFAHWTSGQAEIDKLIQNCQLAAKNGNNMLEWIPYEQFFDIEYLASGGFSQIYKAKWIGGQLKGWNAEGNKWERWGTENVVLKSLTNSQNMTTEFFQEIINYKLVNRDVYSLIVDCYGISQNPETGNYVMVMQYMNKGNLRQFLQSDYQQLSFPDRFSRLLDITQSLRSIHEANLIHQDLHTGNVLNSLRDNNYIIDSFITDLGLSQPANETNKEQICGVLPYVAPEVFRRKKNTQASDIYSLGIIAYELFSNQPPFVDYAYDSLLALRICEGLRPNLAEVIAPQLLKDLISRCWDASPKQRPTAGELFSILRDWFGDNFLLKKHTEFYQQYQELLANGKLDSLTSKPPRNYSTAKYTSRRLDFPNLPQPQNSKELNKQFWNSSEQIRTVEFGVSGLSLEENLTNWFTTLPELNHSKKDFILWLKNQKSKDLDNFADPYWVKEKIDTGELDLAELRKEFREWELEQLQTQIQVLPRRD